MFEIRICTYCGSDLKADFRNVAFCSCGWVDRKSEKQSVELNDKKTAKRIVMFGIAIAVGMAHIFNWGQYSFKIPFVRAQQMTGMLSAEGYGELAQMCINLNKWSCAENALNQEFSKSQNPNSLLKLARLQSKLDLKTESLKSYERYFAAKGEDGVAMIEFGNLLSENKRFADAVKYFEKSIKVRPDTLPVRATSGIVKVMMKQGKYQDARKRLVAFYKSADNASDYLNPEKEAVDSYFKTGRAVASVSN